MELPLTHEVSYPVMNSQKLWRAWNDSLRDAIIIELTNAAEQESFPSGQILEEFRKPYQLNAISSVAAGGINMRERSHEDDADPGNHVVGDMDREPRN